MSAEAAEDPVVWSWRADWTEPVRARPVPVAAVAVLVCGVLGWRVGLRAELAAFVYLGVVGTALGFVDAALRRLPDPLTLTAYPAGLALLGAAVPFTEDGGRRYMAALAGMAVLWVFFAVQWFALPSALGLGDVKLSGVLGLYLGWLGSGAWVLGVFSMFVLGGLYAVGLLVLRRAGRKEAIPFGPFMLLGAFAGVVVYA
ncbi:A24 family peptidase [Spirillospora sp. NPDC029432]|uniref:A24 family peptidase n=1 Tax=Spirillospora sp. NPDC029432 TaxID=3154599 RepID=UPI003454A284